MGNSKAHLCQEIGYPVKDLLCILPQKSIKRGGSPMEKELRKQAIKRHLNGEKPKAIYTDINRSKKWFFKWLKRYQSGQKDWYKDQSKAPRRSPGQISEVDKQRIIETRERLESEKFAQIGASAIKWELSKSGLDFPSDRTINRVLKREGLVKKNSLCSQRRRVPLFY